jgi:hypothetical protein
MDKEFEPVCSEIKNIYFFSVDAVIRIVVHVPQP